MYDTMNCEWSLAGGDDYNYDTDNVDAVRFDRLWPKTISLTLVL